MGKTTEDELGDLRRGYALHQPGHVGGGLHPPVTEGRQKGLEEDRRSSGGVVAGGHEARVGILTEKGGDHHPDGLGAQGLEYELADLRLGEE